MFLRINPRRSSRILVGWLLVAISALRPGWCEPDKSEAMARLHKATGIVYGAAFLYGNYAGCDRLLGFMQSTLPSQSNPSRAQTLEVSKLVTSVAQGKYSQSISPAQQLLTRPQLKQSPSDKILVLYVLIEAGRRAGFPRLVDELLPEAIELADRSGMHEDRFVFHSLAVERQLDKNPDLPLQTLVKEHDACWQMLDGFAPTPTTSGGGVASRAARFWIGEWFKRMRSEPGRKQVTPLLEKDVARLLQLAGAGLKPENFNPQYEVGNWDVTLDVLAEMRSWGRLKAVRENLTLLDQRLATTAPQVAELDKRLQAWVDSEITALKPSLGTLDLSPLRMSIMEGDVSRVGARLHQEWVRLILAECQSKPDPDQLQEIDRRLQLARQAQQLASRGQGFLGLEDVRWDTLALLFRLRQEGWQLQARQLVDESLQLSRSVGFRLGEISALCYQGELARDLGDLPGALQSLKQATDLSEQFINDSGGNAAAGARIRQRFKRAYDLLTEVQLSQGHSEDAFATQGRLQQLEVVSQSKGSAKVTEAVILKDRSSALEQELVSSRASGQDTRPLEKLLARTRGEFYSELTRIRTSNPKYESMLAIRPVNFAQLQKHIPNDTCLVQYFPADQALYIFLATSKDLKIRKIEVSSRELSQLVARFRQLTVNAGSGDWLAGLKPTLFRLHAVLIEPIEPDIQDKEVLAFIPTGVLNYLPMGAVARPFPQAPGGLQYLIERKQIAVVLKSSDLDALASPPSRPQGGVLGLGNPDGTLPSADKEVREVAAMFAGSRPFLGSQATSQRLAVSEGATAYVHLATHGVLDSNDPNASYLLLAGAQNRLSVPQICDLRLDGVRLVTLSACQTALGREEGTQGSELTTLASAFSVAGTNSVVASLWSVSDESTRLLMVDFYAALKKNQSLARALQQAEIKLLKEPRFCHPFYWAPFELIGDWR